MTSWEETFKELKSQYVRGSADRLSNIEQILDLLECCPHDSAALKELKRHFHGLTGSGKTYGFPQVTLIGYQGEQECDVLIKGGSNPAGEDVRRWRILLEDLRKEFSRTVEEGGPKGQEITAPAARVLEILIVDDDPDMCEVLTGLVAQDGLRVKSACSKMDAVRAINERMPDGAIVDVLLPDGSGYQVIEHLRNVPGGEAPPVLMMSAMTGFLDKVEAISCGADGYFEKPVDWELLIHRMQYLLERNKKEAPKILSVEDDPDQASFVKMVLESAGYQVRICSQVKTFDADLTGFRPDLVIMDILLPEVTGYDLVRYLRQNESHATLPVLFLTTEGQMQAKIDSLKAGGDDLLVKPVSPALLLSAVAARIERSHFLKGLMERDGLTKLLTHTAFLERAKAIHSQKGRNPAKNSVMVLLDLDNFKKVNDTYGHPVGDRVLASLSSFLRRRLRQTDTIGRYGGEEFAILIEDLKEEEAVRLMTRLLEEFSAIEHHAPDFSVFHVTFSAGIAVLDPAMINVPRWLEAADRALYAAKAAGRNLIRAAH